MPASWRAAPCATSNRAWLSIRAIRTEDRSPTRTISDEQERATAKPGRLDFRSGSDGRSADALGHRRRPRAVGDAGRRVLGDPRATAHLAPGATAQGARTLGAIEEPVPAHATGRRQQAGPASELYRSAGFSRLFRLRAGRDHHDRWQTLSPPPHGALARPRPARRAPQVHFR